MTQQGTLSIEFREFNPSDYQRLMEVYNGNYPDSPLSMSELRYRDESLDQSKYLLRRYAVQDHASGETIAFARISHGLEMFHPRKYWIQIYVDPRLHGKGIGSTVYGKLMEELRELDAITAWAFVREDLPKQFQFYEKRGFEEKMRIWESRLDPRPMDLNGFRQYMEKVSGEGITLTTLAEERDQGPESLMKVYELLMAVCADMPSFTPFTPISYQQWESFELKNPRHLPEAYMLAKHGTDYVGLSYFWKNEKEPKTLVQGDTGVSREYRGKGVAMALKLKGIDFARRNGYDLIKTMNASDNGPMLALNTKLGFKRQTGWITMEKDLASGRA